VLENRNSAVQRQYELLSILDSKASALLGFDALALASIAVWLGYVPLNYMHLMLDVVFVLLLLSCVCLLQIVRLRWARSNETEATLDGTRTLRTRYYRTAWVLSLVSVVVVIAVSLVHTYGTLLVATDSCGPVCSRFYSGKVFGNLDYGAR